MTGVSPPIKPPPGPVDGRESPSSGSAAPRPGTRTAVIAAGVVLAVAVPLMLVFMHPRRDARAEERPLAQPAVTTPSPAATTPTPAATTPAPTPAPQAAPAASSQQPADKEKEDLTLHDSAARSRRRIETINEAIKQKFDCKAVAKDESNNADLYPVPPPPFTKGIYPCTRCHDRPDDHNETKRTLTLQHTDIKLVHGPREQWCYGCHNPTLRDKLRLAGGRLISFDKSYELCGQCHGTKLRDWRLGIHGKRFGCWNGKKQYLLCVDCHDPHAPKFPKLQPKPIPVSPYQIKLRGER